MDEVQLFVTASEKAVQRATANPQMSLVDLLGVKDDEGLDAQEFGWQILLDPKWNKEPGADEAMKSMWPSIRIAN